MCGRIPPAPSLSGKVSMRSPGIFFSSRRRHTRSLRDWSSDVCSSDLHRSVGWAAPLPQNLLHHVPAYVGQAEVAALEAVGEAGVLDAQEVEDGGVQVVDVDRRSEERRVGREYGTRGRRADAKATEKRG